MFSKRTKPAPTRFVQELPEQARLRIYHTMPDLLGPSHHNLGSLSLYAELREILLREYGYLDCSENLRHRVQYDVHPAVAHFMSCPTEKALDFIELLFRSRCYRAEQWGVERINGILREEGVGYEFTPWREIDTGKPEYLFGRATGRSAHRIEHPVARKRGEEYLEETAIRPALHVLADPRFATANGEMRSALEHARKGKDDDALTDCGSAFESVLRTICTAKGWHYDPDKATCADLVKVCKDNGLFYGFYAPIFEATGTIRNKLGDAHGRGPTPLYQVSKEHVEHAIQMTAAHIVLLVGLAKL